MCHLLPVDSHFQKRRKQANTGLLCHTLRILLENFLEINDPMKKIFFVIFYKKKQNFRACGFTAAPGVFVPAP